jgi:hypothetical protein
MHPTCRHISNSTILNEHGGKTICACAVTQAAHFVVTPAIQASPNIDSTGMFGANTNLCGFVNVVDDYRRALANG